MPAVSTTEPTASQTGEYEPITVSRWTSYTTLAQHLTKIRSTSRTYRYIPLIMLYIYMDV